MTAHTEQERAAKEFAAYITDCDKCAIAADAASAFNWAWQAARRAPAVAVPSIAVTAAMVEAASEAYCPFGDMELAIQAAINAAPQPPEAAPRDLPRPDVQLCVVDGQLQPVVHKTLGASPSKPLDLYTAETVRGLLLFQTLKRGIKATACHCEACDMAANGGLRSQMSVCPNCKDKRCPRAAHHNNQCAKTGATK